MQSFVGFVLSCSDDLKNKTKQKKKKPTFICMGKYSKSRLLRNQRVISEESGNSSTKHD